jgi:hypothetical protein
MNTSLPKLKEKPFLVLDAVGVQIYRCELDTGGTAAWKYQRPSAKLSNHSGAIHVDHGAGPSWSAKDGSKIIGKVIASTPSPHSENIPWLQLSVQSEGNSGLLSETKYIERIETKGGIPNSLDCTPKNIGEMVEIPYTAVYLFYRN